MVFLVDTVQIYLIPKNFANVSNFTSHDNRITHIHLYNLIQKSIVFFDEALNSLQKVVVIVRISTDTDVIPVAVNIRQESFDFHILVLKSFLGF